MPMWKDTVPGSPPVQSSPPVQWFVAKTRYGQEVLVRDRLRCKGMEYFIPTQKRTNARGKTVEKPLLSSMVFMRVSRREALDLANKDFLPVHYMIDCATHTLLTVPDREMENFQRVLRESGSGGSLTERPLALGDGVKVTRGPLRGVEGYVLELLGKTYVVVELLGCLWAKAKVPRSWLVPTGKRKPATT